MNRSAVSIRVIALVLTVVVMCQFMGCAKGGTILPKPPVKTPVRTSVSAPLRLTEVLPYPAEGEAPWIELYNPSHRTVSPHGQWILLGEEQVYKLDKDLEVPARGFVVLQMDLPIDSAAGTSTDDAFQTLHIGVKYASQMGNRPSFITSRWTTASDTELIDFVAWGGLPPPAAMTEKVLQVWKKRWFVTMMPSTGIHHSSFIVKQGCSLGLLPGVLPDDYEDWVMFLPGDVTKGSQNKIPKPTGVGLIDGSGDASGQVTISWTPHDHDSAHLIELATDSSFENIVVQQLVRKLHYTPDCRLPDTTVYARVKAFDVAGHPSEYSEIVELHQLGSGKQHGAEAEVPVKSKILRRIPHRYQKKDTRMLCLHGCLSEWDSTAVTQWDTAHQDRKPQKMEHGSMNCARASISMIAAYYDKPLSQDRIAYFDQVELPQKLEWRIMLEPTENELNRNWLDTAMVRFVCDTVEGGNLAHNRGVWSPVEVSAILNWALQDDSSGVEYLDSSHKPTFEQLHQWLDLGRPILTMKKSKTGYLHACVMSGYQINKEKATGKTINRVHILDPAADPPYKFRKPDTPAVLTTPITYDEWLKNAVDTWICPADAPYTRQDEPSIKLDSDIDSVVDFDEEHRFFCHKDTADSDHDGVRDKNDIRGYVFTQNNVPLEVLKPNFDKDEFTRKENDFDNDNDNWWDGSEDLNRNGLFDPDGSETDCFFYDSLPPGITAIVDGSDSTESASIADRDSLEESTVSRVHVLFAIDYSGSANDSKREMARRACSLMVDTLLALGNSVDVKVGLIYICSNPYFDTVDGTITTLGDLNGAKKKQISTSLEKYKEVPKSEDSTATGNALITALGPGGFDLWSTSPENVSRHIIVLSDGEDNCTCGLSLTSQTVRSMLKWGRVTGRVLAIGSPPGIADTARLCQWAEILRDTEWQMGLKEPDQSVLQRNMIQNMSDSSLRSCFDDLPWWPGDCTSHAPAEDKADYRQSEAVAGEG